MSDSPTIETSSVTPGNHEAPSIGVVPDLVQACRNAMRALQGVYGVLSKTDKAKTSAAAQHCQDVLDRVEAAVLAGRDGA